MNPYRTFAIMLAINAAMMFALTYALVDQTAHILANINRVYMALLMTIGMIPTMLLLMRGMYPNKRLNYAILAGAGAAFVLVLALMRTQTPVGDVQFLRSMIPHQSSAIVMCEHARITDAEIETLCGEIVEAQKREIAQMQAMLDRY
jgi:uncharacterized protein (DUF305 family)